MQHKLLKNLARLLLFALLAGVLLVYADRVLWDKSGTIMGFYEEPKNTIDVLYVGGSHTNAAISPTQIFEEQGCTGYVLYSWSQPIWTGYHYLLEGLKTQTPKVVVLDAFGLVYGNTYMTDVDMNSVSDQYSLLIPPSLNRLQLAIAMSRCQTEHKAFYSYFSLFQYHNRWKALTVQDLLWPLEHYRTSGKGFGPLYTTEVYEQHQPEALAPNSLMYGPALDYLQKFIALSREKGFSLVLVNYPYICSEAEYGIYASAKEICDANGVAFVDYLLDEPAARAGFDYAADMAEHAHVNYKGAAKLSADLGAFLKEHYDLPDHRADPAFADWKQDAAQEDENLRQMDLRMTADLDSLLTKAEENGYLVLMGACGDLGAADSQAVQEALNRHGYDRLAQPFEENAGRAVAVRAGSDAAQQLSDGGQGGGTEAQTLSLLAADGTELTVTGTADRVAITAMDPETGLLQDMSRNRPGLNVVVANPADGTLIFSVSFSTLHDYTAFTA